MRANLEIVLTLIKVIVSILVIGAILVVVIGGVSIGVQLLWKLIPFGFAGFILGLIIIGGTYYFSREYFPERKLILSLGSFNKLAYFEQFGYLYGVLTVFASIMWFFLPNGIIKILPSYVNGLGFSIVAVLLIYGIGFCLGIAILSFRVYLLGGFFYLACGILCWIFVNYPIWSFTEKVPTDYYILGKALLSFIIFLQLIYIALFHVFPAIQKYKKELAEEARNAK